MEADRRLPLAAGAAERTRGGWAAAGRGDLEAPKRTDGFAGTERAARS